MKTTKAILLRVFALLLLAAAALAQDPVPLYPDNYKVLLENDRVRALSGSGGFLLKDVVLLGAALWTLGDSLTVAKALATQTINHW
jgi:hypothetical protein